MNGGIDADQSDNAILSSMADYYDARAEEYDDWWYRRGRYDRGAEERATWLSEARSVLGELEGLCLQGDVLELASGTGIWTELLVKTATSVTALDSSLRMIVMNKARVRSEKVTYLRTDLFSWSPSRLYDAVVFCFWLSHVPRQRLEWFASAVSRSLSPGGSLFFVDSLREPTSTAIDHSLPPIGSGVSIRKLNDGREFRVIKNFYSSSEIGDLFERHGLEVTVSQTPRYFYYGIGKRV